MKWEIPPRFFLSISRQLASVRAPTNGQARRFRSSKPKLRSSPMAEKVWNPIERLNRGVMLANDRMLIPSDSDRTLRRSSHRSEFSRLPMMIS